MKGVIFNVLEEVVGRAHGDDVWDVLLERAGLEGAYTSLGSYDDSELFGIVGAASSLLELPQAAVLHWAGRRAIPVLAERWPDFFASHASTLSFLRSLNGVIHPEVHKLYPGARCPHFDFSPWPALRPDAGRGGGMLIGYRSPRRLCALAHGFIDGTADHYGESVVLEHRQCMNLGDAECVMSVVPC